MVVILLCFFDWCIPFLVLFQLCNVPQTLNIQQLSNTIRLQTLYHEEEMKQNFEEFFIFNEHNHESCTFYQFLHICIFLKIDLACCLFNNNLLLGSENKQYV